MSLVRARVPQGAGPVPIAELLEDVASAAVVRPFDSERVAVLEDFARLLGRRSAAYPEARALSYWLRRSELRRLQQAFEELEKPHVLRRPRGTAFHVPPANVDTMFVYSWALSALVGNRNVVRLSTRRTRQAELILEILDEVMKDHPSVAAANVMIEYGHDDAVSRALSAQCDVRVVWGGDATVEVFRSHPLPPHARELVFPDRESMAVIDLLAYEAATPAERDVVADRFAVDNYVFDQLGCSSARTLVWITHGHKLGQAHVDFYDRVTRTAQARGYEVDAATTIAKLGQAYRGAVDHRATAMTAPDPLLTLLDVAELPSSGADFCGGGFLFHTSVDELAELVPHVTRRHQTLSYFGVGEGELLEFADLVNGRGVDRVVPIGRALQFDRWWDGHDLLTEFTRVVTVVRSGLAP